MENICLLHKTAGDTADLSFRALSCWFHPYCPIRIAKNIIITQNRAHIYSPSMRDWPWPPIRSQIIFFSFPGYIYPFRLLTQIVLPKQHRNARFVSANCWHGKWSLGSGSFLHWLTDVLSYELGWIDAANCSPQKTLNVTKSYRQIDNWPNTMCHHINLLWNRARYRWESFVVAWRADLAMLWRKTLRCYRFVTRDLCGRLLGLRFDSSRSQPKQQ